MNTISFQYTLSDKNQILALMKNQNNVVRFIYNRLQENKNLTQKELTSLTNSMNNISIDSWFKQSAIYKAKALSEKAGIIFGGKFLFLQRLKNKISKEEFQKKKLIPLYVIGESNYYGNRKFELKIIQENKIIFKPKCGTKIELLLPKLRNNYKKILYKLQELGEEKKIPITISLDLEKIYLTYDERYLQQKKIVPIKNRIMSLDLNPNYVGYSIIDWKDEDTKNIIKVGMISIKKINDKEFALTKEKESSSDERMKYLHNKRSYEIFEIDKMLVNLAKIYKTECFCIEELKMKSKDKGQGKNYNRLVNNLWNRGKFVSNLEKRLNLVGFKLYKLFPQYSSFIGNLLNRTYPDCVAASIEMNRRGFCFKERIKPVLFPDFRKSINVIKQSLEELVGNVKLMDGIETWKELYKQVKNSKLRYRVSLEGCKRSFKVLSLFDKKSLIEEIQFG
jgi:hypothetical protein